MEEKDVTSVSEEILTQADEYLKELLKNKRLNPTVKAQLEIQSYFLTILTLDHERLNQIYPYYKQQRERQEKINAVVNKLIWIVVPFLISGFLLFLGQFIYFWIVVVPKLSK